MTTPIRVLHVTTGLETGGAETLLFHLVSRMDRRRFHNTVLSLTDAGPVLGQKIQQQGLALECLNFPRGRPDPRMVTGLAARLRALRPDVIQTWMYHADLVGALARRLAHGPPLVWGIHSASLDRSRLKRQTVLTIRLCARLSHRSPTRIICCSEAARAAHVAFGYAPDKMSVIPNGVDLDEFIPRSEAREGLRRELGLSPDASLIGLIARLDPQKDHQTFFRAAGLLRQVRPNAHFVLCGAGVSTENRRLAAWMEEAGVRDRTHLLGIRSDVSWVTAALDVATCCSTSESFGLTLGEAMACGVPCVTTDLEGPKSVVGELGRVVPVGDPAALARAWQEMLDTAANDRKQWGEKARERIHALFSLQKMVQGYESLYQELCPLELGTR